jgi:hypothetical protein
VRSSSAVVRPPRQGWYPQVGSRQQLRVGGGGSGHGGPLEKGLRSHQSTPGPDKTVSWSRDAGIGSIAAS